MAVLQADATLQDSVREAVILARRRQGLFKQRVMQLERACRITGVNREEHLRASHCKPWRDASNEERLYKLLSATPTTFVSVSHHDSIREYHQNVLELHGDGKWRLRSVRQYSAAG